MFSKYKMTDINNTNQLNYELHGEAFKNPNYLPRGIIYISYNETKIPILEITNHKFNNITTQAKYTNEFKLLQKIKNIENLSLKKLISLLPKEDTFVTDSWDVRNYLTANTLENHKDPLILTNDTQQLLKHIELDFYGELIKPELYCGQEMIKGIIYIDEVPTTKNDTFIIPASLDIKNKKYQSFKEYPTTETTKIPIYINIPPSSIFTDSIRRLN